MHLRIFSLAAFKGFFQHYHHQLRVNDVNTSLCHSLISYVNQLFPGPALQVSDAVK